MQVICNYCGSIMEGDEDDDVIYCPNCDNEAFPGVEDPDAPGETMQMIGPFGSKDY